LLLLGVVLFDRFVQTVLVQNIGTGYTMQQHVHAGDAQHGGVKIKAPEHIAIDVLRCGSQSPV
jgi:hypothetical protein